MSASATPGAPPTGGTVQTPGKYIPPPPPLTPAKPPDPKMGSCEETYPGSTSYYYVFGGKPLADWSGIEDPSARSMSDLCSRSLDPVACL